MIKKDSLIEQVEDGVLALLQPLIAAFEKMTVAPDLSIIKTPGVEIETLPDNKAGIQEALQVPRVTVTYVQSSFGTEKESTFHAGLINVVAQEETLNICISVRGMGPRRAAVYPVMEAVRGLVFGKVPLPGALGLWFTNQNIDELEQAGGWRYMLFVATSMVIVSDNEPAESLVNKVVFAWSNQGGN